MSAAATPVRYRFGRFELQPQERRLLAHGAPVAIGPRAFDLLATLVARAGHLVTKDELLERVWPKVIVEEAALQMQVSALRKVLGRDAIATVTGRGYRFALVVAPEAAPPDAAPAAPRHNLPQPLTSFIGREQQLSDLKALLGTSRLLTLMGSGGCGKTRLAMQVASDLTGEYPDGVWLVEFAALADPQLVPAAVARVFGLKAQAGTAFVRTIADHLAAKQLLLLLDNAEHVLEECAQLAFAVLSLCPELRILVTSRERLGVAGELTYRVPSLAVPDRAQRVTPDQVSTFEAARLFIDRALLQQPGFVVTPDNAPALASICRRLDGIPLAIELAAARVRLMPVEEVSRRLHQRFELLTEGSRTALPRHRTLRALIDWSYRLLNGPEQALLRRVSVFSGGWTLAAAEHVCAGDGIDLKDVLDLLTSLADKSLAYARQEHGETRFELLETVRHYARDHLAGHGEEARLSRRHFDHMFALAQMVEGKLASADYHAWLERLETELENLRVALAWSCAGDGAAVDGLRLAFSLRGFWGVRGLHSEGRRWLATLIAAVPSGPADAIRAHAMHVAAGFASNEGDYVQAEQYNDEALAIFRRLGDRKGISHALNNKAAVAIDQGRCAAAQPLLAESMQIRIELGDQLGASVVLNNLGIVAQELQDYPQACACFERGLAITRSLGHQKSTAMLLTNLSAVLRAVEDHALAEDRLRDALVILEELADRRLIAACLEGFAAIAVATAQPLRAAVLWGRAERLREEITAPIPDASRAKLAQNIAAARLALRDEAAFSSSWKKGRDKPLHEVTDALLARRLELLD